MMSQPAISKHLSVLENAGLVWREKRGQNVHYGLKEDALTGTLVHFLAEVCPRSRPFRKESAAAAKRKRSSNSGDSPVCTWPRMLDRFLTLVRAYLGASLAAGS